MAPKRAAAAKGAPATKKAAGTKKTDDGVTKTATKTATKAVATKAAKAAATKKTAEPTTAAEKKTAEKTAEKKTTATKKTAVAKKTTATKKTTETAKKAAPAKKTTTTAKAAPKTAAAKKTATRKSKTPDESDKENAGAQSKTKTKTAMKRKRDDESESEPESDQEDTADEEIEEPALKRAKAETKAVPVKATKKTAAKKVETAEKAEKPAKPAKVAKPKPVKSPKAAKPKPVINHPPTDILDIFVFGEGSQGELGLGHMKLNRKSPIDVKRPRPNHNLKNVVQVACGGMHAAALTKDNKILTWGVNDNGALGRNTNWEGGLVDADVPGAPDASPGSVSSEDDDDDTGLNPKESTPAEITMTDIPEGTVWVQIVASDSATFALTNTGLVYGWGNFRDNEGGMGFRYKEKKESWQGTPMLIPELSKITHIAAGANHILALDDKGKIFAWGAGEQSQLGRRLLDRDVRAGLIPTSIGKLPARAKAAKVACGAYHSFAIDTKGRVIGWGLNNYAELGTAEQAGVENGFLMKPTLITALEDHVVADIAGGFHHSLARTAEGVLLTWGRIDGNQTGQTIEAYTHANTIWDNNNKPRILFVPTPIEGIEGVIDIATSSEHNIVVTAEGKAYSWGYSGNFQTGLGREEDVAVPTQIDNSVVHDRKLVWCGTGGQYGMLGAVPEE